LWLFYEWESRLEQRGVEPLVRPSMLQNIQLGGGLRMFFIQYFVQSGVFFIVQLFLSVSLGLSAIDTGVRIVPLSITLLLAAAGIPRFRPNANPRRVVRLGLVAMFAGTVVLMAAIDENASAEIVTLPLLLLGFGIGALASQLGAVTVSAVPDEQSPEARPPEHSYEPRRIARYGARGPGSDRQPHHHPRGRHPGEPGRPARRQTAGRYAALQRRPLPVRRRPRIRARGRRRDRQRRLGEPGRERRGTTTRAANRARRHRNRRRRGTLLLPHHPHAAARITGGRHRARPPDPDYAPA
jgi:hypothetical protein